MIDFSDIPAFVAAAESGGFSAAGRRLNVSRSAVGKAIARLEDRIGARLFHRTTRQLNLTEDGQAFLERCQRALHELQAGRAALASGQTMATGTLRVSMPVLFGRLCVAPVLIRLAARHPDLALELDFRDGLVDLVEDGFDLAVRTGALGTSAGLMRRRIMREETVVCASPRYAERWGLPDSIADLAQHQAITYARAGRIQAWRFVHEQQPIAVRPPSRVRLDDLGAILDAALAGVGLAWLPDWLINEQLASGALIRVLPGIPSVVGEFNAIWPEGPHLPMRVRVAIDALAALAAPRSVLASDVQRIR